MPSRAPLSVLLGLLLAVPFALLPGATASAADPTTITAGATSGYADTPMTVAFRLGAADGTPLVAVPVVVERLVAGTWRPQGTATTDAGGRVALTASRSRVRANNTYRATYAGDEVHAPAVATVTAGLVRRAATVRVVGPSAVKDGARVRLVVVSTTGDGRPVSGPVRLQRKRAGERRWRTVRTLRTAANGRASYGVRPRGDTRWRATTPLQDWVRWATSPVHRLDNRPPGKPVRLPAGAPRPKISLPPQPRATTPGADPVVTTIPDGVWNDMVGRSWHAGCPVGRDGLRLLRVNYWGYDGYRYRGEVVGATGAVDNMARALTALYRERFPIRSMYRVDRFGWSSRLQGANDYASMDAGNTSGFNCRSVVNRPGVRSPHSYGGSLDINTWENPYRSATGLVPNSWWQPRSHPRVAWRSGSHRVVQLVRAAGFSWTYGTGDSQHFDATGGSGRLLAPTPRACRGTVCH